MKLPNNKLDIITPRFTADLNFIILDYPEICETDPDELIKDCFTLNPIYYKSPLIARKATEIIAFYFRREFEYDFPQYSATENTNWNERTDKRDRIFLITQTNRLSYPENLSAIGAVVFRWRNYTNAPPQRVLAWVWIHPFLRRNGILSNFWPLFKKLYGNFHVEPPLSVEMNNFLKKYHYFKTKKKTK